MARHSSLPPVPTTPKAHWKAGRVNRAFGPSPANSGPNRANTPYVWPTRSRVRDSVRNSPLAARAVNLLVSELVGTGIVPLFQAENDGHKRALNDLWRTFVPAADYHGHCDFYGLQALAARAIIESGECFVHLVNSLDSFFGCGAISLNLLEADMVPLHDGRAPNGNAIYSGIEVDGNGRRVAYWVHKKHPGDSWRAIGQAYTHDHYQRIEAEDLLHLYEPQRPGQLRGFPRLATALQTLQQFDDYNEATLERQKLAASLTLFIRRPAPIDPGIDPVTNQGINPDEVQESVIVPGSAYTLLPGEEVTSPDLPTLGEHYPEFSRTHQRLIAAAIDIPYELLTGDWTDSSDRTARVTLGAFRRRLQQQQKQLLVHGLCRPVWQRLAQLARLSGELPVRIDTRVEWVPQAWPYINPLQDVQASAAAINAGIKSRTGVIAERGDDPERIDAERLADALRDQSIPAQENRQ